MKKYLKNFALENADEINKLRKHACPECGSIITDTISLKSKRYNLDEDITAIKNELQLSIQTFLKDINDEEETYKGLLNKLHEYDEKVQNGSGQINDILKYKGMSNLREEIVNERNLLMEEVESDKNRTRNKKIFGKKEEGFSEIL